MSKPQNKTEPASDNNALAPVSKRPSLRERIRRIPRVYKITIIVCAVIIVLGKSLNLVRVVGDSMHPTYESGEVLVTSRNVSPETLDYDVVVVFYDESEGRRQQLIKRIVGVPGDEIQIVDGILYRNGNEIDTYFSNMNSAGVAEDPIILGDDEYFVLGDNRNNSRDSRVFGPIDLDQITNIVKTAILVL